MAGLGPLGWSDEAHHDHPSRRKRHYGGNTLELRRGLPHASGCPGRDRRAGTAWSLSPEAGPSGCANALNGVSCFSVSMCTAVGGAADPAEAWTGSAWVNVPAPSVPGSASEELSAVVCTHTAVCTAVGTGALAGVTFFPVRTLAELWAGQRWRIQAIGNAN